MNSEETQQDAISPVTVQPASGFIAFGDDEIEQSIPERLAKLSRDSVFPGILRFSGRPFMAKA